MAQPQTQVIDCSSDSQTRYTITIPANAWMSTVKFVGVTTSGACVPGMILDAVTANYMRHYDSTGADGVVNGASIGMAGWSGTTFSGLYYIMGALLAAPTYFGERSTDVGMAGSQIVAGYQSAITAHSTFDIQNSTGATYTGGTIFITHFIRKHEIIESVDFSSASAISHDFAFGKNTSAVIMAPGLTLSGADTIHMRTSTDGVTFDSGALDYQTSAQRTTFNSAGPQAFFPTTARTATTNGLYARFEGVGTLSPTALVKAGSTETAEANPFTETASRASTGADTHLRMYTLGGATMNGGIAYLVGAR